MTNLEPIKHAERVQNIINKFCFTIGMIPSSYKLSLTYEEQILAIGNYLETTVYPAINNNAEALAELQTLFVELKNYVDNYFEDLDVQNYINSKIEEMQNSGELQEMIINYLQMNGLITFNNIEEMKQATNLIEGSFIKTYGFYNYNDNAGAFYKVRRITNNDVINNMTLFQLKNELLVAELVLNGYTLDVTKIGASPILEDNSEIIQFALDNFLNITLPNKTFKINKSIKINRPYVDFNCLGTIKSDGIEALIIDSCYYNNINIKQMTGTAKTGTAIKFTTDSDNIQFINLNIDRINNFDYGLLFAPNGFTEEGVDKSRGVQYCKINFDYISCNYGISFLAGRIANPWVTECTFTGGALSGITGLYTRKGENSSYTYHGNKFYNIGFEHITNCVDIDGFYGNNFVNCRMSESIEGTYIKFGADAYQNNFSVNSFFPISQIIDNNTHNTGNYITAQQITDLVNGTWMCTKLLMKNGIPILLDPYKVAPILAYGFDDYQVPTDRMVINGTGYYLSDFVDIRAGSNLTEGKSKITLNNAFGAHGITKFFLSFVYKSPNVNFNVYDSEGNIIIPNDIIENKKSYLCVYNKTGQWKIYKMDYISIA